MKSTPPPVRFQPVVNASPAAATGRPPTTERPRSRAASGRAGTAGAVSSDDRWLLARLAPIDQRVDAPLVIGLLLALVHRPLLGRHGLDLRRRAMSLRVAEV